MLDHPARPRWSVQTQLVHDGLDRSGFGETAEALYLTSGYVYESAEQAADRFSGEDEGYIYSRYGNPTVSLFERRLAALEGTQPRLSIRPHNAVGSAYRVTGVVQTLLERSDIITG